MFAVMGRLHTPAARAREGREGRAQAGGRRRGEVKASSVARQRLPHMVVVVVVRHAPAVRRGVGDCTGGATPVGAGGFHSTGPVRGTKHVTVAAAVISRI